MFEIEAEAAPVTDMTKTHETLTTYPAVNKDTIALDTAAVVAAAVRAFILGTVTSTIFFATITSVTKSTSLCLVTNSLEITFPQTFLLSWTLVWGQHMDPALEQPRLMHKEAKMRLSCSS